MNKQNSKYISLRYLANIFGGIILTVLAGFYFFNVSAQTETVEKFTVEKSTAQSQNLTIGKLAFSSQVYGPGGANSKIYTTNPDGSERFTIPTSNLFPEYPAWSPDGTKLAFAHWQPPNDIYSVNADGSGLTNLTNTADTSITERSPSWSVSGKIAYERNGQIWVMNQDGSGQQVFSGITQTSVSDPVWSPDGTKLAYVSANSIWIINADGTNPRQLTPGAGPSWSPDGTKLVFGRGGILIINADGTNETTIATSGSNPSWSPDGTKIAYRFRNTNSNSGIYTMDINGGNQARVVTDVILFPLCCDTVFDNPTWQPVAQTSNTYTISGRITNGNFPVVGATVDLSGPVKATTTTDAVGNYQFSVPEGGYYTVSPSVPKYYFTPANRYFVNLSSNQTANFEVLGVCNFGKCVKNGKVAFATSGGTIHTINPDGTGLTSIAADAPYTTLDWSPDGTNMVFFRNNDIYKMNADGSGQINLTNAPSRELYPSYSPDGKTIVFVSDRDGNDEIYKMNSDGTNPVRLTNNSVQDVYPSFSPDGQKIVFVSGPPSQLYTMNADGSNRQQVPGPPPDGVESYLTPSFSPDGSNILFTFRPGIGYPQITRENPDGSNRASLALGLSGTYSPDGSQLAYVCCLTDNTYRLSAGGQILNSAGTGLYSVDWQPVLAPRPARFDFSGDGRSDIAFFRPSNNLWYIVRPTGSYSALQWGLSTDVLVPGDYDGDMKTDAAVWRPSDGNFYILNSLNNTVRVENFGLPGDIPTGGDWDGDGKADLAVYRDGAQGVFYYRGSMGNPQGNISSVVWGLSGDKPVVGDYDGDGKTDAAVYRNGNWYINQSSTNQLLAVNFGLADDKAVPADYDGDGKTDIAVFRNGVWYLLRSSSGFLAYQFGATNDVPVPADYDGDGKTDAAVFRNGGWWILNSQTGRAQANSFGSSGDKPIPSSFVR